MRARSWVALVVAGSCLGGCYRSAQVPLERVRSLQTETDDSMLLELEGGGTQRFPEYDTLVLELERPSDGGSSELELKAPLRASLDARNLRVATPQRAYEYARPELKAITLSEYAPSRPYVILGISLGAMLLGGLAGGSAKGCNQGGELCGLGQAYGALLGGVLGLGAGLGISIPVTSTLDSESSGVDEAWRPRRD